MNDNELLKTKLLSAMVQKNSDEKTNQNGIDEFELGEGEVICEETLIELSNAGGEKDE